MGDSLNDSQCVTHHYACECREKMLADEIARWRTEALAARPFITVIRCHDEPTLLDWVEVWAGSMDVSVDQEETYAAARAMNEEE